MATHSSPRLSTLACMLATTWGLAGTATAQTTPVEPTYPPALDGTMSAYGDQKESDAPHSSFLRQDSGMGSWFAWKREVQQNTGIGIGGSYQALWQHYSSSVINQRNAVGGKFTLNLSYDLMNRGQPDALGFDVAIEDRRPIGTDLPPLQAGMGAGSVVPTAATYGDFKMGITQAYIRQNLFNNKFQYTVGKIFAPNFIDAYPFFDDNRQFLNQSFSTSPTIAAPLRGFGAVAAVYPTETGFYLKPGVFTNHSSDTGSTIGDFFSKNERFYMLEAGWSGLARSGVPIQARAAMDSDNIHLTTWYREPTQGGLGRSKGVAFNANYMAGENLMWFTRAGWSQGWAADRAAAVGLGWRPAAGFSDLFGVAVGWVRPTHSALRNQTTAEVFYRFHVTPQFAVTPDLQYIRNPSLAPRENSMWVLSLRGRLAF